MAVKAEKFDELRRVITENLRVQKDGTPIKYVNVGTALQDACSRQNHAIFARRGCGKTLLLHHSASILKSDLRSIYLNCEDFKRHSFPNVLIEILRAIFKELDRNLSGWFGRKKQSKEIIREILSRLDALQLSSDSQTEDVRTRSSIGKSQAASVGASLVNGGAAVKADLGIASQESEEIERSFRIHKQKLEELDNWLPDLKSKIRTFFGLSKTIKAVVLQIDDLYHLKRTDQAFVVDYIHRLCKDLPLYFKIATLRHASTLYLDRDGQPIGAQERHDYQPINIDYTFAEFGKTALQNWTILQEFAKEAGLAAYDVESMFKGEGFNRLVMAGGGVPRDVLSLFLEILSHVDASHGGKIGKDEVRILSRSNFERKIAELKQDSKGDEQDDLIKGIYIIREFCLSRKTNIFLVQERMLQENDMWRSLFYRLLDYRIIHSCASALTHKSAEGTYQAFSIDIGCYAHLRKLQNKFSEIDVSAADAKDKMRSAPILEEVKLETLSKSAPQDLERALSEQESEDD